MPKPNFFLLGMPKAGTTSIWHTLSRHPEVYMSPTKEPDFFCSDLSKPKRGIDSLETYLDLFSGVGSERVIGEASVLYSLSQEAPAAIKDFNPNSKCVLLLREPISFLRSLQRQFYFDHDEKEFDFEDAWRLEKERRTGKRVPEVPTRKAQCFFYSEHVKYATILERWYKHFDRRQFLVCLYEDFRADNKKILREILSFLEVDEQHLFKVPNINPGGVIDAKREAWWQRFREESRYIGPVARKLLPEGVRTNIRKFVSRNYILTSTPPPNLDPAFEQELRDLVRPEMKRLETLLERDLSKIWRV